MTDDRNARVGLGGLIVPILVAVLAAVGSFAGAQLQAESTSRAIDSTYVTLAIDILREPIPSETDEMSEDEKAELRQRRDWQRWAFTLLQETSPTPLSDELTERFKEDSDTFKIPAGFLDGWTPTLLPLCTFDSDGDGRNDSHFGIGACRSTPRFTIPTTTIATGG